MNTMVLAGRFCIQVEPAYLRFEPASHSALYSGGHPMAAYIAVYLVTGFICATLCLLLVRTPIRTILSNVFDNELAGAFGKLVVYGTYYLSAAIGLGYLENHSYPRDRTPALPEDATQLFMNVYNAALSVSIGTAIFLGVFLTLSFLTLARRGI